MPRKLVREQAQGPGLEGLLQSLQMEDANQDFFSRPGNIQLKTHLTRQQVVVFAKAARFAEDWEIPELADFVLQIMTNAVSLDRLSRREWREIMSAKQARTHIVEEKP